MCANPEDILKQIEQDIKSQQDFELSIVYDAERNRYLVRGLKKAIDASGMSFSTEEFKKFLSDLDSRLFPKKD